MHFSGIFRFIFRFRPKKSCFLCFVYFSAENGKIIFGRPLIRVIQAVEEFLEQQETDWYRKGLQKLEERWTKCIEVRGDYVEQ